MAKSVLVLGARGQLGQSFLALAADYPTVSFEFVGRDALDLADLSAIAPFFAGRSLDAVVNCAAYTAVDKAESDAQTAELINHLAVGELARVARQQGFVLVHVSTDYVFDGRGFQPYTEDVQPNPQNVYGQTKLAGERAFLAAKPRGAIFRTSWVYSEFGANFVKTMLRLGAERDRLNVVCDQIGSPTYAGDLAEAILRFILVDETEDAAEVFHFSNQGVASWYDFAVSIFALRGLATQVSPIPSSAYPTPAVRPFYSVLDKSKISARLDWSIPHWQVSLARCLGCMDH